MLRTWLILVGIFCVSYLLLANDAFPWGALLVVIASTIATCIGWIVIAPRFRETSLSSFFAMSMGTALVIGGATWLVAGFTLAWVAAGTSLAMAAYVVVPRLVQRIRVHRWLAKLNRTLERGGDASTCIDTLDRFSAPALTFALRALLQNERPDLVITVLTRRARAEPHVVIEYRLVALLELGRVAEARAVVDETPPPRDLFYVESWELYRARLAIAEGVVPTVSEPQYPFHRELWLEVRADACALGGDREAARQALQELQPTYGAARFARLARGSRPASVVAAALLAETTAAYR